MPRVWSLCLRDSCSEGDGWRLGGVGHVHACEALGAVDQSQRSEEEEEEDMAGTSTGTLVRGPQALGVGLIIALLSFLFLVQCFNYF